MTNTFFSLSEQAQADQLLPLVRRSEPVFQQGERFILWLNQQNDRLPRLFQPQSNALPEPLSSAYVNATVRIICSIIILFMWSRSRQAYYSPRRLLQRAITVHQLCLHYQPIIDIRNGTCVGAEALLRWPGYHGPVMSPCEFIPLAEKEG